MTDDDPSDVVRGSRFSGGPARGFLSSLAADERLFEADLAVDRAHVVMLAEQGIITESDAGEILEALADVESAGHDALPDGEDVHAAIETAVVDRIGPVGGKLHTARSRNDEVATCLRYRLRTDVLDAVEATIGLRLALAETAAAHVDTLMPGFTHRQHAQPTTLAHYLCSYEGSVARDTGRLFDAYGRIDECPLGAAAFAGTPFDVDRARVADLLGFAGLVDNAMDAVSARDFLLETVADLTALATTLSGLAEDAIQFSTDGYVELSDDYASTSSIMPQKKNPDTLELVRATAGDASAGLNGLLATLKGLPRAYNRDLQRAHPHAFETVDAVLEATDVCAGAIETATWDEATLADAAGAGFSTATGVADLLAMQGVPFRSAHDVVRRAAERTGTDARTEADTDARTEADTDARTEADTDARTEADTDARSDTPNYDDLAAAAEAVLGEPLDDIVAREAVEAALDPAQSVASRDSRGGPAPAAVEAHLETVGHRLGDHRATVENYRELLANAAATREDEVERYV